MEVAAGAAASLLVAAALLLAVATRAEQPGVRPNGPTFDCNVAATPTELRICLAPDLTSLDIDVARAYSSRLATLPEREAGVLKREQRVWLQRRNSCGGQADCIRDAMRRRLAELGPPGTLSSAATSPAPAVQGQTPAADARDQALAAAREQRQARLAAAQARRRELDEARLARRQEVEQAQNRVAAANAPVDDATPDGDEWRGAYTCDRADAFMRLVLLGPPDPSGKVDAVIETGPAPEGAAERTSFRVTGVFAPAAGALHLEPQAWIHQPYASTKQSFGLDGLRTEDDRLTGKVLGPADCSGFRAWHVARANQPAGPAGLLDKTSSSEGLSTEDCRTYARWLASGHELHIGSYYVSSLVYDADGQRRVLGRTAEQWHPDDHARYRVLARTCQEKMTTSATLEDTTLVHGIALFSIAPFDRPKRSWLDFEWDRAELAPLLRAEAQERVALHLSALAALPAIPASYATVDREAAIASGQQGELHYLEDGDRAEYRNRVAAQRLVLGRSIAQAMADRFAALPPTIETLQTMTAEARATKDALVRAHDPDAAQRAEQEFRKAQTSKATQVWPLFLKDATAKLGALDGAGYGRFPDILAIRNRETVLRDAGEPPDPAAAQSYQASYAALVDAMVQRSMPRLIAWTNALPPSAAANHKLDAFTSLTFGASSVPDRYGELKSAVAAKRGAYNPDGYRRPDIVMSLLRQLWPEVAAEGLEDISYFATALHALNDQCPGVLPQEGSAESSVLISYALDSTKRAVDRLMRGEVRNETEKRRAMLLAINTFFNRPGCRTDGFGNALSCTSFEEQSKAQEAILTSEDAVVDMHALGAHGCGSNEVRGYVRASLEYAAHHHGQSAAVVTVPDAWAAAATP